MSTTLPLEENEKLLTPAQKGQTEPPKKVDKQTLIEAGIDKGRTNEMTFAGGTVACKTMSEVMEFAKLMSVSNQAVPAHLRGQPGFCLAICIQAMEWRFSPFAVANKSYVVNDRVSYESQLIHAVIEERAPIVGRLRHSFSGKGDTRRCKVWAMIPNDPVPLEYESPEFKDIKPKNSPLWTTKPDLQLFYNASRDWARMWFPEVIIGVYTEEEVQAIGESKVEAAKRMIAARTNDDGSEDE